jgi:phosphocarrier protein
MKYEMPTVTRDLLVENQLGLHLRAAAKIVHLTNQFKSSVTIHADGVSINAKSIMNIAMLAAGKGTQVQVELIGGDAEEAAEALERLFRERFGED